VILEQINSFDIPTTDEGFDAIERITWFLYYLISKFWH
jgi:hypothetical protein